MQDSQLSSLARDNDVPPADRSGFEARVKEFKSSPVRGTEEAF